MVQNIFQVFFFCLHFRFVMIFGTVCEDELRLQKPHSVAN